MNFNLILDILLHNDEAFSKLIEKYPNLASDLNSAKTNQQCSCRNRVVNYLQNVYSSDNNEKMFLDSLVVINPTVEFSIKATVEEYNRAVDGLGKVYTLKKKENFYKDFLENLKTQRLYYYVRSLSIVDKGDEVDIYLVGWRD